MLPVSARDKPLSQNSAMAPQLYEKQIEHVRKGTYMPAASVAQKKPPTVCWWPKSIQRRMLQLFTFHQRSELVSVDNLTFITIFPQFAGDHLNTQADVNVGIVNVG